MSVKVSTFYLTSYKKYLKRSYAFKMKKTNRGLRNSEIQSNYHHKMVTSHPHFATPNKYLFTELKNSLK